MKGAALAALLGLAACDQIKPDESHDIRLMEAEKGRFQMVADAKGDGVYLLDTRSGEVAFCLSATQDAGATGFAGVTVSCTEPSKMKSAYQAAPRIRRIK